MNTLIAIISCLEYANNGVNQSIRDTWLKRSMLEHKFFIGDGTPVEETAEFETSWKSRGSRYIDKTDTVVYTPYCPKEDEVVVAAPDDYKHISYKTRESHRWALRNGFDYLFQCYGDIYADVDRLLNSGFEKLDYCGGENGGGFCLSRRALELTANATITAWNDDGWVRDVLRNNGIKLLIDHRYGALPNYPKPDNDYITAHLCISPDVHTADKMYQLERKSRI